MLIAPCLILIVVVLVYPVLRLLAQGFHNDSGFTLTYYAQFFSDTVYLRVLWITLEWSALVTVVCLVLAYPVAYLLTSVRARTATLLMLVVAIPLVTSLLVRTYAWIVLLGRQGVINVTLQWLGIISEPLDLLHNSMAVVIGLSQVLLPFMVLTLYGVMKNIDRQLILAARTLGPIRCAHSSRSSCRLRIRESVRAVFWCSSCRADSSSRRRSSGGRRTCGYPC